MKWDLAYREQGQEISGTEPHGTDAGGGLVMSVKRKDLVRYFEQHGFYLLREGANHSIYTNNKKTFPY